MARNTLNRIWKPLLGVVALGVAAVPWIRVPTAAGSHGSCPHSCRCSRLEYFDRLLPTTLPGHTGDALGAVQQTVGLLLADRSTDWSEVEVGRLRQRLVDLNEIVMYAEAEERDVPGGLEILVGGSERTRAALGRVVPEHARRMEGFRGWSVALEDAGEAMKLTLMSDEEGETRIVRALGFFGFLASGVHRPQNHLALVRGRSTVD